MFVWMVSAAFATDPALTGSYQLDPTVEQMAAVHDQAVQTALDSLPWALREFARRPVRRVIYNCGSLGIQLDDDTLTLRCDDKPDKVLRRSAGGHTTLDGYGERVQVQLLTTDSALSVQFERSEGTVVTQYSLDGDTLRVHKSLTSHMLRTPVTWEALYHRVVATPEP